MVRAVRLMGDVVSWHVEVFEGEAPGSGNAALVLQAAEVRGRPGYPVVVGLGQRGDVRFAAPAGPLRFCGHGLLAAGAVWCDLRDAQTASVRVGGEVVPVGLEGQEAWATLPGSEREQAPADELLRALGVGTARDVFLGRGPTVKWFVEVDAQAVDGIEPDVTALAALSAREEVAGAFLFARLGADRWRARSFNPRSSAVEDRATGSAVAALCSVVGAPIVVDQGPPRAPLAQIAARPHNNGVRLAGRIRRERCHHAD